MSCPAAPRQSSDHRQCKWAGSSCAPVEGGYGPMESNSHHWVGTWAAAPAPSEVGVSFNNHTLRMNPRISIGGDRLRVRISNAYGTSPLRVGGARVALRDKGPAIVP